MKSLDLKSVRDAVGGRLPLGFLVREDASAEPMTKAGKAQVGKPPR